MVFSRRCPNDWEVFYNQPETRMAPELLPLFVHSLKKDYSVNDSVNLSKGWFAGSSFAFDVCSTEDNILVLATVTGILDKPFIQLLISYNAGESWTQRATIPLGEVPLRIRVAAAGSRILTACTFKKHDGYHVMAAEIPLQEPTKR
jgi:hypothetical protein